MLKNQGNLSVTGNSANKNSVTQKFVFAAVFLLVSSCARMGPPPGGPEDTEPPRVESITPAQDSTGVALDTEIELVFSEKVRREQAEPLVKLNPEAGRLYFKWDGRAVRVRTEQNFRPAITYRLIVEPGLVDLHRVKSEQRFESYFSTGKAFSPGRISGTVQVRDSLVVGGRLRAVAQQDTTLVFTSGSDSSGAYLLPYLPLGSYRVEAFRDLNRNNRFDYTREEGADTLAELVFEPLTINFTLQLADTTAPVLKSVETPDSLTLVLVFDDRCDTARGIAGAEFELRTPDSLGTELAVDSTFLDSADTRRVILKPAGPLIPENSYHVRVTGIVNEAGLEIEYQAKSFRYRPEEVEKPRRR